MHEKIKGNDKNYYDITMYYIGTLLINVDHVGKYLQIASHLEGISTISWYIAKITTLMYVCVARKKSNFTHVHFCLKEN